MKPLSIYWRILFSIVASTIIFAIIWYTSQFREPPDLNFLTIVWFLIVFLTFEVIHRFQIKAIDRGWLKKEPLLQFTMVVGSILVGLVFYVILFYGFKWIDNWFYNSEPPKIRHMTLSVLSGLSFSIVFSLIIFLNSIRRFHFNTLLENERMKNEITEANLNILKNQLDPHFLFNNLNTLYYLIDGDKTLAKSFLKNISGIYRQILLNKNKASIPAKEEYTIAKQYLAVIQRRYESALIVEDSVSIDQIENKMMPPLVIQQLIENAIKHNIVDAQQPLSIVLSNTSTSFQMTSQGKPKRSSTNLGSGLNNIKKRYGYLTDQKVIIESDADEFKVTLPLLSNEN